MANMDGGTHPVYKKVMGHVYKIMVTKSKLFVMYRSK
jgi:hypothetical protein